MVPRFFGKVRVKPLHTLMRDEREPTASAQVRFRRHAPARMRNLKGYNPLAKIGWDNRYGHKHLDCRRAWTCLPVSLTRMPIFGWEGSKLTGRS
jgi:hypothetical protein